jgi:hypothetical protein
VNVEPTSLNAEANSVVVETLEFAHEGVKVGPRRPGFGVRRRPRPFALIRRRLLSVTRPPIPHLTRFRRALDVVHADVRVTWMTLFVLGALSSADLISMVAVAVALTGVFIAFWQTRATQRTEGAGLQPVVVVYESTAASFSANRSKIAAEVFLHNHGPAPAFDVKFGVAIGNYWCCYRPSPSTLLGRGELPRVIETGTRAPLDPAETYHIEISPEAAKDNEHLEVRRYWCEYENALGERWRTENHWRYEGGLDVTRVAAEEAPCKWCP